MVECNLNFIARYMICNDMNLNLILLLKNAKAAGSVLSVEYAPQPIMDVGSGADPKLLSSFSHFRNKKVF